ncbi:Ral guanine nucleotide dissociation stimulator-like 1 [Oryzias melastigma]|uniref:Ral guanine nucleotide dissociation stimulator-like 1 n=1 Tax=Oryzias melastigma TaxID=30732 RepID=A0A3B3CF80_ORYME|nr:ral guanine nucleotide dissociation stimulator-like 1 [Oryzias melastigma]KAF6720584.1 Ral guanine nucleotide dissociation stimulator-like 1 [Oryzias melastigma]
MGKWEITMNPVQEWGEETEDGVVYGVTLHREPVSTSPNPEETGPCSAFIQYRTCKVRRLKAATLERLVNHLLDGSCQEPDVGKIFLSTYRTFTSTTKLIEMLFQRDSACSDLEDADYSKSPLLTLIQTWLDDYSEDFRDPPLHPALRLLLDHLRISSAVHDGMRRQPNFCSLAGQADELLKSFQKQEEESTGGSAAAEEGSADEDSGCESPPDPGGIMDFSTLSIAEQLTRMDSALFVKVVLYQCLGCVWSQRDKKENMSPTIRATITQFNAVTNQVMASLLCPPVDPARGASTSPAQRARVIEKWIKVAQDCRRLKNFSSLKAILSALQSNAVYRLRKTWAAVSRDSMAAFDNLCDTFPDENCVLTNRELLTAEEGTQGSVENASPKISKKCPLPRQMSTSGGVVPYLGTYLSVLTMLDTALPDMLEDGLINFEKRRREFDVLSQIRVMQACCSQYNLPSHPRIAAWLQGNKLLSDQESHELSRQLEPPVDLCSPASWSQRSLTKKLSSLLSPSDGSKKVPADQISVSSSGSSGSEMEDFSSPSCSIRLQSFHSSCNNVSETFSSSSCSSATSALDSPTPSRASSDSSTDLSSTASPAPKPHPHLSSYHKRSVSMTALPVYNQQGADSCIIRVSVDLGQDNGNMYKSILLTSQDKTAQVIQRALEKHHLEHMEGQNFSLTQVISQQKELVIPDKANVFYAMSTTANFDFVLRQQRKGQKKVLRASASLSRLVK